MSNRVYLLLYFTFFSLISVYGDNGILLEWEEVENTLYYTVDIKKDGILLFTKKLEEPRLTVELSPGTYEYRISLYNKFEKISGQSDWQVLTVIKNILPEIIRVQDTTLYGNDRRQTAVLEAVDVMDGATISLINNKGSSRILEYEPLGFDRYRLILDTKNLKPGYYGLSIKNPSGSETLSENIIYLKEKMKPKPIGITPDFAYLNDQIPHVYVDGEFFQNDIVVFLVDKEGIKYRIPLNSVEDSILDLWFDLKDLKKGSYDLLLINKPYEETLWEDSFTIIDEKEVRDEDYYEKIRWGTDLLIGFPLMDLIYQAPLTNITMSEGEIYGLFPEFEVLFRLDFSNENTILKYFGLETRLATLPNFTGDFYFTTYNFGIYGKTRFNSPVNILLHGDMGYRFMNLDEGNLEGILFTGGLALQLNYDQWLFEFSLRNDLWFMQNLEQIDIQQFSFRTGYRF
jgi:hypothetical protein